MKDRTRIALLDDYQNVARQCADWSAVERDADIVVFHDHLHDEDAIAKRLLDFDIVCLMRERTPMPASLIARLPRLKLIVTSGPRNASVDMMFAASRGIPVCGTSSIRTPTAELTWMFILALARGLPKEMASVRSGGWQTGLSTDLHGATLGLIGLGDLGGRVASMAPAFGMNILAWSQNLTAERATAAGARLVTLNELLEQSDFVSIHLQLSDRTRGLIGAAELARMKPTAYLVNTSRGPIIDEAALIAAMQGKRIAGAGVDAFEVEPLPPDHPFRKLDNVIATPHIGYVTRNGYNHFFPQVVEDVRGWMDGKPQRVLNATPPQPAP